MMAEAHIPVGIAAAVFATKPTTPEELCLAVLAGTIGAGLPDADLAKNKSRASGVRFGKNLVVGIIFSVFVADLVLKLGLTQKLIRIDCEKTVGAFLFSCLYIFGMLQPHRHFTHSLVCAAAYTMVVSFAYRPAAIPFATAYISHICLDLLTKGPVYLFWPADSGWCLRLCKSNGLANKIFAFVGSVVCVGLVAWNVFGFVN